MRRKTIVFGVLVMALVGVLAISSGLTTTQAYGSGSVLLTNTCNTSVWESVGGIIVKDGGTLKAGQTWYVTKEAKSDGKGGYWAEVFITGKIKVYVPAACFPGISGVPTPTTAPKGRTNVVATKAAATAAPTTVTESTGGSTGGGAAPTEPPPTETPPVFDPRATPPGGPSN